MLLALAALVSMAPQTVSLIPKETIWVYENASSPSDGTFLRAWGVEGKPCPAEGEELAAYSYSFVKWDLSDLPAGAKLVSATIELNNIPDPGFSVASSKKAPIEARALTSDFDAKKWTFDLATKIRPDGTKAGLLGSGYAKVITTGSPVAISINLTAKDSPFLKAFAAAQTSASHSLSLALTSSLDPSVDGRTSVYKVYGQNEAKENLRPKLVLTFEKE